MQNQRKILKNPTFSIQIIIAIAGDKMYTLKIMLIFGLIQLPFFHFDAPSQERINNPDLPNTGLEKSKSEQLKSSILPLVQIFDYSNRFTSPTTIEYSTWRKGEKFLTAETQFSGPVPGIQTFWCGNDSIDEYGAFPVYFTAPDSILQCTQEPKPFIEKYLIKSGIEFIDVPCGENKRGRLYQFGYKLCIQKDTTNGENQNNLSDPKGNPIQTLSKFESYRFCLNIEKKELLYTKHILESLDLLSDKRLKQERQISYKMITDGYHQFDSWFEEIKQRYDLLELQGYKPMKLVPSNHFPLASWKKPTYHYLNTMPIHKNLRKLWEHIVNSIRGDGIQRKRQYKFYTRAFPIKNLDQFDEEIQSPDIWITVVEYTQKEEEEEFDVGLAIILNNKFEKKNSNSVTEFIIQNYCEENICKKPFPQPFADVSQSVHCCPINDAIKLLFEKGLGVDRVLQPDFLFEPEDNSVEDDTPQLSPLKMLATSASNIAQFGKMLSKVW